MANLQTEYMGLKLKNPIIVGSSGITNSLANIKQLAEKGAGAVVLKSMFEEQIQHETESYIKKEDNGIKTYTQAPESFFGKRIYDYDEAYAYIHEYAKSNTMDKYLNYIGEVKKAVDIPVIASINCVSGYDWHLFAKRIQDAGADALELNIYVLPSDFRHSPEENEKIYYDIIEEVKQYITIPIAVKLGYYFTSLAQSLLKLSESGIKGMVLFNRPYNPDIDIEKISLSPGNIYSSDMEYGQVLRWISILSGRVHCDLSATTGIHNYEAIVKHLLAGANTVQIVSALYLHKFDILSTMLTGLNDWMDRHHFETIEAFRGKLSSINLENPAAIERVQFMKLYAGVE